MTPKPATVGALFDEDVFSVSDLLSADERAQFTAARDYIRTELAPLALEHWVAGTFPTQILATVADAGISRIREQGGSALLAGLISAEIAKADLSFSSFVGIHDDLATRAVLEFGSPDQHARVLPELQSFRRIGAFALTEPLHGSDVAGGLELEARRTGDEWVLTGEKRWIGNSLFDGYIIVWARDADDGQVKGFIVEGTAPGLQRTLIENKLALRIVQNADLRFDEVRVREADRLPGVRRFSDLGVLLRDSRMLLGWQAVGVQSAAYELARDHALSRIQFGKAIGSFQLVQSQLVTMLFNLNASRALMVQAARLQDDGTATIEHASLLKAHTSRLTRESVAIARGLFGGNGVTAESGVARLFNDTEALYTYEGTFEVNSLIAGRGITGISAFV